MAALGLRRLNSISRRQIYQRGRRLFHRQVLSHLFRIVISLLFLPLNSFILCVALATAHTARRAICPKTILVTGIDTPHGLHLARCWYNQGHRVVGADIAEARFPSGGSLSRALVAHYRFSKSHYVSRLLDIVVREKVDIWIPCAQDTSAIDDGMAKQAVESRTSCRCVTLDTELASQWSRSESFVQYLINHGHPIVEHHEVQFRDSIHRILHRSPAKAYLIRKTTSAVNMGKFIILPKRTLSSTYSEVSGIQVSKDSPWIMQQHARLGEFIAEALIIRGHVAAIMLRSASPGSDGGCSRVNGGLAAAAHQVVDKLASQGGSRVTGHFLVRLMVDEQLHLNSVRYEVHIAGCTQGAAAIADLLQDMPPRSLVYGYLAILEEAPKTSAGGFARPQVRKSMLSRSLSVYQAIKMSAYQAIKSHDASKALTASYPVAQKIDWALNEAGKLMLFWTDWRFSIIDPQPWWWHTHVYWPFTELDSMLESLKRA
ncbi:hypothetical protein BDW66DRAFT_163974 [Aspergillus desertorum]